ncbi:zinc finger protein 221-like [Schistocerca cancellata]|uniref:zinc finger protein 221-like n=1 Tax=Schistocerca cancellata TaxID=274614 RepID=UPI0021190A47|nr:zinc finger protein 221-like [Schistocerca cancellata]
MLMTSWLKADIIVASMQEFSGGCAQQVVETAVGDDCNGFRCKICGKQYKWSQSLRRHQQLECGKEPQYSCGLCSYRSKQKAHLKRHLQLIHRAAVILNRRQNYLSDLIIYSDFTIKQVQHELVTAVDVQRNGYRCDVCGKRYNWPESLRRHQKFECGKEPQYFCSLCPYRCKQKGNLKRHILSIHTSASFPSY